MPSELAAIATAVGVFDFEAARYLLVFTNR
jgi:hypothetical protein